MDQQGARRRTLVTGAGGFIGHHLVKFLKAQGQWVRAVDVKKPEFEPSLADEFLLDDMRSIRTCERATTGIQDVYALAADMGGIGYISANHASLARNNVLMNANTLEASQSAGIERYLYTSSACVYPGFRQHNEKLKALKESDAIPADPEKGYGWEKLFAEQLVTYYHEDYGLDARIVRLHNIYGPLATYEGGREKAPAAICKKVAEAEDRSTIEVWGDGRQTRSFCYIDDCVDGLLRVMDSGYRQPINIGSEEIVTVDELVDMVCRIAGKSLEKSHDQAKPQGVRGRNSDNTLVRQMLQWEPKTPLQSGLARTYRWIWSELEQRGRTKPPAPIQLVAR